VLAGLLLTAASQQQLMAETGSRGSCLALPMLLLGLSLTEAPQAADPDGSSACSSSALRDSSLNLSEVAWSGPEQRGVYIGAPSIVRLPSGDLLVSSNAFGSAVNFSDPATGAVLHKSTDEGESFATVATVANACDNTLFVLKNTVYFLGPACHLDAMQLSRGSADGTQWPVSDRRIVLTAAAGMSYANAPTAVVEANGKVYRAVESVVKADNTAWGSSLILFATVPPDKDGRGLLEQTWTASKPLPFAKDWPRAVRTKLSNNFLMCTFLCETVGAFNGFTKTGSG
jgi:hypothetical protein